MVRPVLTTFQLSAKSYELNQLRYDLRKLKGHGLLKRDGRRYAYRLPAGVSTSPDFPVFSQTPVRSSGQQPPLPSPQLSTPAQQQT